MSQKMFEPIKIGAIECPNRFFMAPLTRCRASMPGHVPNALMAEYYAQRASAGLIIAEATMIQDKQSAFLSEPGVYSQEQVNGWKRTTEAVHAKGGRIFLQIWHGGRQCCPLNNDGEEAVSSVGAPCGGHVGAEFNVTGEKVDYPIPRALKDEEMPTYVELFKKAAENAKAAGFDGVEIHGANGYLIDQFLRNDGDLTRQGNYGGSIENNARFLLEVVDACIGVLGADRVGVRLSPLNSYGSLKYGDVPALVEHCAKELEKRKIAFLHMMRGDFFQQQQGDVLTVARKHFTGPIVANMGYTPEEAEVAVASKAIDAVAFGTKFLATPDLPTRVKDGKPLNEMDPSTFYKGGEKGYTDYPAAQ